MEIAWSSGLSDQNLVTNPQCYKDRQNRSSLLSVSMIGATPAVLLTIKYLNKKMAQNAEKFKPPIKFNNI